MYVMIDLWPFPHIPGPSDWVKSIASMFFGSQIGLLKFSMSLISGTSKATETVLQSDWFSYRLGGWTNLGLDLFPLVVICVTTFVLLRYRTHSASNTARLIRAIIVQLVFVRLYYPVVGFVYDTQQKAYLGVAHHFAGTNNFESLVDKLTTLANPVDVISMFFGSFLGWVLGLCVATTSVSLFVTTLGLSLLYPIIAALSPIGSINGFFARMFHLANAALVAIALAPLLMIFWIALGIEGITQAQKLFPTGSGTIGLVLECVVLLLCIVTPITLLWLGYHTSLEVFGRTDSKIRDAIDLNPTKPLTTREALDRPDHNHRSLLRQAATTAVVSSLDDKPKEPLSRRLADMVAMGAMAIGQPEVAAAAKVVSRTLPEQKPPKASPPPTSEGGAS